MLRQRLVQPSSDAASKLFALRGRLFRERAKKSPVECAWCGMPTKAPFSHKGAPFCSEHCARSFAKHERKAAKEKS